MAKIRPLGDKILVKRVKAESKTKSGTVLPDSAKEKPKRGKILALGEGKRLDTGERAPFSVKKGDEVIFTSYAGTEIKLDGEELMIMSEEDILAVLEKAQAVSCGWWVAGCVLDGPPCNQQPATRNPRLTTDNK